MFLIYFFFFVIKISPLSMSASVHELPFPFLRLLFLPSFLPAQLIDSSLAIHLITYFITCCMSLHVSEVYISLCESLQRFCLLKKEYMESFEAIFQEQYETIHRLETNKLRNVARMFAHLLYTDSVPWSVSGFFF